MFAVGFFVGASVAVANSNLVAVVVAELVVVFGVVATFDPASNFPSICDHIRRENNEQSLRCGERFLLG